MEPFPDVPRSDWAWRRSLWPDPEAVLRELGVDAGSSVAEVGVGAGYFALPAATIVDPATVYLLHPDGTLLDEVEAAALEAGLDNVRTISGRADAIASLLPDPVDAVLVVDSFHEIEAPTAFAEQVSRSLRPGGRLVVVEWLDRPPEETTVDGEPRGPPATDRLTPERLRTVVAPVGLEVAARVDLPPHHYGLVFKRGHDL